MKKKSKRWPTGWIVASAVVCWVVAGLLYWASVAAERAATVEGADPNVPEGPLSLPAFMMAIAIAVGLLGVFCVIWLVQRIRHDRIPPWERSGGKPRL